LFSIAFRPACPGRDLILNASGPERRCNATRSLDGREPRRDDIQRDKRNEMLAAARRKLADLLRPATPQETELVAWLGRTLDLQQLLTLAELISYRDAR
jgi:hypothetical protein